MKKRLDREYFEELYETSPDPWNFETSEYERKKYRRTLESLGERKFRRALEAGCSIGVFTEMLAPRCGELLAADASERAVSAARKRLEEFSHVRVERRTLPEEMPGGTFDLIIASEVLYFLDRETMLDTLRILENSLEPGGLFLAVHWRKETMTYPLQGDEVHGLIRSNTRLDHIRSEMEPEYRLDLFEARDGRSGEPGGASRSGTRSDASGAGGRNEGVETSAVEASGRVRRGFVGREAGSIEGERGGNTPTLDPRSERR
ncbi:MAG: methyltransferase [Rubrobacter sp.]|nr:methyltransferase [Rubrobacter sp.]